MSAGASRRRTLMRPGAQHLSLSLVEHPSFKFRTYGAYGSLATPATSTLDDSGEDGDMAHPLSLNYGPPRSTFLSARAPPSAWKSGAGLFTPFTAMTAGSVYSQDSWGEPEPSGPGVDKDKDADLNADPDRDIGIGIGVPTSIPSSRSLRSLSRVRVDTRRFGMAFGPNANFILPLASASVPSPANYTFVLDLQSLVTEEVEESQTQSLEETTPIGSAASPPAQQNDKIAEVPPQLPVAAQELKRDPPIANIKASRSAKSSRFTINRTSSASASLRSSAKGLTRLLSCVSLPTHLSRRASEHKPQTAKHPHSKKQTAHPVPAVPNLPGDESLIVFDPKTSGVDAMQMVVSDGSIPGSGALTSPTTDAPEKISRHTHARLPSSMHLETVDSHTLPAIAISPLEVTFGGSVLP